MVGVMAIETSVAAVTVRMAELLAMLPEVAVMDEVPIAMPVATPPELMVATAGVAEFQLTVPVMFWVLPSP